MNIQIGEKDDIILKILHYFITEEDYKPVIINGLQNEIWLENMQNDLKLIRINTNYIHNLEQYKTDLFKASRIMKSIKKNTFSLKMSMLNLELDASEYVDVFSDKNIQSIKINSIKDFKNNEFVIDNFPSINNVELSEKLDPVEFVKLTEDMNKKTIKNEKRLAKIFSPKKPVGTYVLIVLNILVYLYSVLFDDGTLLNGCVNNYELIQNGQYYRLITSMFLHADILHIGCNMYALYILGPQVERYYGTKKFLFIYFLSGLLASIFSAVFMSANTYGLGASGAIFGLFGSITYFSYYYRATLPGFLKSQILPVLLVNLGIGLFFSGVDLFAHIGGLIGGILVSMAIGLGDGQKRNDRINGIIVYVVMTAILFYMVLVK